jgi:hypothetical protein
MISQPDYMESMGASDTMTSRHSAAEFSIAAYQKKKYHFRSPEARNRSFAAEEWILTRELPFSL